jgi:hypothetical protein
MISKISPSFTLLVIASYSNLTLILQVTGALPTPWDNITKTHAISYSRKTNILGYEYHLWHAHITNSSSIKGLGAFVNSKLYFHNHVDFLFSECIKLLGLIRSITFRFSSLDCFYALYFMLVRFQVEICLGSLEFYHVYRCQQAWAHPAEVCACFYRFPPHVPYSYNFVLEKLSLHSLHKRRYHIDIFVVVVVVHIYRGLKSCTSFLENISLRVPNRKVRDFPLFGVCPSNKHCPSARCAYAANAVGKSRHICNRSRFSQSYFIILYIKC